MLLVQKQREKMIKHIVFLLESVFLFSCASKNDALFNKIQFSQSSSYYYEVEETEKSYFVKIYSKDKFCEFSDQTEYRKFDRFFVCWDDMEDILWIWSSDIGFYTVKKKNGWIKESVILANTQKDSVPIKMIKNVPFLEKYYK